MFCHNYNCNRVIDVRCRCQRWIRSSLCKMNPLLHMTWLLIAAALASCGRPGDGQESGSDKHEWSILQALEATNRSTPVLGVEVTKHGDYKIASLMAEDGVTRIWIMLAPASPPFYKQMPSNHNFSLTKDELEKIRVEGTPITTTYQALESHVKSTNAEQVSGGKSGQPQ